MLKKPKSLQTIYDRLFDGRPAGSHLLDVRNLSIYKADKASANALFIAFGFEPDEAKAYLEWLENLTNADLTLPFPVIGGATDSGDVYAIMPLSCAPEVLLETMGDDWVFDYVDWDYLRVSKTGAYED